MMYFDSHKHFEEQKLFKRMLQVHSREDIETLLKTLETADIQEPDKISMTKKYLEELEGQQTLKQEPITDRKNIRRACREDEVAPSIDHSSKREDEGISFLCDRPGYEHLGPW